MSRRDEGAATDAGLAVVTRRLCKTYHSESGDVVAVVDLDLSIHDGEFFGLLGPNGAGKSTTIGMLTTLVIPTAGTASVRGIDVTRHPVEVKRRIGMVSQNNTLDRDLTVAENLEFRGRYFGFSGRHARHRAAELLGIFNLSSRAKAMPFELSGGQAKRLMICRALVHRPDVLFLDEPTAGLDPQTRVNLWDTLRTLQAGGQTILLTTHYLEEAEALCERVAIIDRGRLLACDTVDGLKRATGADTVITVAFDGAAPSALEALHDRPGVNRVEIDGTRARVFTREVNGVLASIIESGAAAGVSVTEAAQQQPSLETVFLNLTGREYRE